MLCFATLIPMNAPRDIVGIFDSGVGGMSVLKEIRERMPTLDIIYLGDTARAPYGNRSENEVKQYTKEILTFLKKQGCTHFVSACNSISAMVTKEILEEVGVLDIQYIDMVQPTKKYFMHTPTKNVLVFATMLTTNSKIYEINLAPYVNSFKGVGEINLARQIEFNEGLESIKKSITDFLGTQVVTEDTQLLLACTHYPLVRYIFEDEIGKRGLPLHIVDPAVYVAEEVYARVDELQGSGEVCVYTTKESDTMKKLVHELGVQNHAVVSL